MDSINAYLQITNQTFSGSQIINNFSCLHAKEDEPHLRILWMYPDVLSLHGGRGDMMALLRFGTAAGIPLEIRRIDSLTDKIRLKKADMLYFCCGDLNCVPDIVQALKPLQKELASFASSGKVIIANGSSGAILAKTLTRLDGSVVNGLGLLRMSWFERNRIHGDDLWMNALDDIEVIGNEISRADITLESGQDPFGQVRYGHGNCGDGFEGAVTGNVIYTGCLGPVLVRNPFLAMEFLRRGAQAAGLTVDPLRLIPDPEDISIEAVGLQEARTFIKEKMSKESN